MPQDLHSKGAGWSASNRPKGIAALAAELESAKNENGKHQESAPANESEAPRMDEALNRSKLKNRALFSIITDLVFVVRKDGLITEFHAPKENEFHLSPEGLIGKRLIEILPVEIARQAMYYLEKALRSNERQSFICQHQLSGRMRNFEARIMGSVPGEALILVHDVTERKQFEKELLEITSREQMRIGQDLHDGLGQHLTGITFLSRALENKLSARGLPEAAEAAEIGKLVMQALAHTRSLARGLFPLELEINGLTPALKELSATVEKLFKISCELDCDESIVIRDQNVANHLFRLAQEAISNSVKHGKAQRVVIGLKPAASARAASAGAMGHTVLTIKDDGSGFPQGEGPSGGAIAMAKGLGLRIMHYRAQKIGGQLDIQPGVLADGQNRGTIVTCMFQASNANATNA